MALEGQGPFVLHTEPLAPECRIKSALGAVDSTGQLPVGALATGQLILPAKANQTEQFAATSPALPLP